MRADPIVHGMLVELSKTLNLEPHQVVPENDTMAMCIDLEIHKTGNQYIVLGMKCEAVL